MLRNRIFVSYSQKDRPRVRPLVELLRARRVTIDWDEDLAPGQSLTAQITDNLKKADRILVFLTEASSKSEWVLAEADLARSTPGKLVPALLDDVEVPAVCRDLRPIDLKGYPDKPHLRELDELATRLRHPSSRAWMLWASLGASAAVMAALFFYHGQNTGPPPSSKGSSTSVSTAPAVVPPPSTPLPSALSKAPAGTPQSPSTVKVASPALECGKQLPWVDLLLLLDVSDSMKPEIHNLLELNKMFLSIIGGLEGDELVRRSMHCVRVAPYSFGLQTRRPVANLMDLLTVGQSLAGERDDFPRLYHFLKALMPTTVDNTIRSRVSDALARTDADLRTYHFDELRPTLERGLGLLSDAEFMEDASRTILFAGQQVTEGTCQRLSELLMQHRTQSASAVDRPFEIVVWISDGNLLGNCGNVLNHQRGGAWTGVSIALFTGHAGNELSEYRFHEAPETGWSPGASTMFRLASKVPRDGAVGEFLRNPIAGKTWQVAPGSRFMLQINHTGVMPKVLEFLRAVAR